MFILSVMGQDFNEPMPPEVTFSSGDMTGVPACATFGIINDNNLEFDHEFTVSLLTVTPTGPNLSGMRPSTMVIITDDEGMHAYCDVNILNQYIFIDMSSITVPFAVHAMVIVQ